MDRLTSLTVFVQVVDSGGFSAAARHLNMSTTMVSNHIQTLEDRLGARLLNRTTRKVNPTEIGRAYYDRCAQILNDLEEADSMAEALQSSPRGTLRLYTNGQLAPFLGPVVDEFLSLYPQAGVDLTIGERMVDLIEEGFDLAIRATPTPDRERRTIGIQASAPSIWAAITDQYSLGRLAPTMASGKTAGFKTTNTAGQPATSPPATAAMIHMSEFP